MDCGLLVGIRMWRELFQLIVSTICRLIRNRSLMEPVGLDTNVYAVPHRRYQRKVNVQVETEVLFI